jgi:hypothetical protein
VSPGAGPVLCGLHVPNIDVVKDVTQVPFGGLHWKMHKPCWGIALGCVAAQDCAMFDWLPSGCSPFVQHSAFCYLPGGLPSLKLHCPIRWLITYDLSRMACHAWIIMHGRILPFPAVMLYICEVPEMPEHERGGVVDERLGDAVGALHPVCWSSIRLSSMSTWLHLSVASSETHCCRALRLQVRTINAFPCLS